MLEKSFKKHSGPSIQGGAPRVRSALSPAPSPAPSGNKSGREPRYINFTVPSAADWIRAAYERSESSHRTVRFNFLGFNAEPRVRKGTSIPNKARSPAKSQSEIVKLIIAPPSTTPFPCLCLSLGRNVVAYFLLIYQMFIVLWPCCYVLSLC